MTQLTKMTVGLFFSLSLHASTYAQGAKPIPIESVLKARAFAEGSWPELSPDGKWVAYLTVDRVRESHGAKGSILDQLAPADLWITSTENGETRRVTNGIGINEVPSWSPDSSHLAFYSDPDGNGSSRLWLRDSGSGKLRKLSEVVGLLSNNKVEWLSDSRSFVAKLLPEGMNAKDATAISTRTFPLAEPRAPGSTVTVFRSSKQKDSSANVSAWNLDHALCDLAVVDTSTGIVRRIARQVRVYKFSVSPDGARVAFSSAIRFEKEGSQQILYDIRSIDMKTDESRVLAPQLRLSVHGREFTWSPNSSFVAYCLSGQEERTGDCFSVDALTEGPPQNLTNFIGHDEARWTPSIPAWSADSTGLYFIHDNALWSSHLKQAKAHKVAEIPSHRMEQLVTNKDVINGAPEIVLTRDNTTQQSGFYGIDMDTGAYHDLLERGENYSDVSASRAGDTVLYTAEDVDRGPDIWTADHAFEHVRQLTHINPELEQYHMGKGMIVSWNSLDGQLLRGALLLPADYQKGMEYPLIVWVYGGQANLSSLLHRFGLYGLRAFNFQLLASRGYAVLLPDAPEHLGTPMSDLVKSVLPGVDKVIQMGIVDPARLGVAGHSRGGYSALSLIVQTSRFKAAMMADGFGDLISGYGELQDDGVAFQPSTEERRLGGNPWQVRERYIENSPLFYLDRIETPLLVVHGMDDKNVFPNQSDEVFEGLRRLDKDVVYARYGGETHSPSNWTYANQLDFWTRVIAWFDRYLTRVR